MFPCLVLSAALSIRLIGAFFFIDTNITDLNRNFTNPDDYNWNLTDFNRNSTDFNWNLTDFNWNCMDFMNCTGFNITGTWNGVNVADTNEGGVLTDVSVNNSTFLHADPEMDWVVFNHIYYCGFETVCNAEDIQDLFNSTDLDIYEGCGECSCDKSCQQEEGKGCCPDLYPELQPFKPEPSLDQCEIVLFPFNYFSPIDRVQPRMVINKCPENVLGTMFDTALKCSQDYWTLWQSNLQDYAIPVTDRANYSKHYKNVFCALCNGLEKSNLMFWQIQTISTHTTLPTNETSDTSTFLKALHSHINDYYSYVYIQFQPPPLVLDASVACKIDTCNISGMWPTYDDKIERACHLYNPGFNNTFTNVFCSMCNGFLDNVIFTAIYPYSFLLDVARLDTYKEHQRSFRVSTDTCSAGSMYDPLYKTCRQLTCSPLFLMANNECYTMIRDMQGFIIRADSYFKLTTPQLLTSDFWIDLKFSALTITINTIKDINTTRGYDFYIMDWGIDPVLNVSYVSDGQDIVAHHIEVTHFALSLWLKPPKKHSLISQSFEDLVDSLNILYPQDKYFGSLRSQVVSTSSLEFDFLSHHNTTDKEIIEKIYQLLPFSEYDKDQDLRGNHSISSNTSTKPDLSAYQHVIISVDRNSTQNLKLSDILHLKLNHTCLKLLFYKTEYILTESGIYFPLANKTLPYMYVSKEEGYSSSIGVCVDTYKAVILDSLSQIQRDPSSTSPINLLSVVCSSMSVLSLLVTIAFYGRIEDVQTVPGWIILMLCISLMLAQLNSIIFHSLYTQLPTWLCRVLGLSLHFFHLAYLFWINVNMYHFYQAFTQQIQSSRLYPTSPWYVVYVYASAAVFVLINSTLQLATSQAEDLGYGGDLCSINTTTMLALTLLLPLSVVLCVNLILAILVIIRSSHLPDITLFQMLSKRYIIIFLNLTILTGLTWILDIIYQWKGFDILIYIYMILDASQGLFIFVVMILKQKIQALMIKD